jgi:molybdate transport system ATP-binding protein
MSRLTARFDVAYPGFRLHVEMDVPASGVTALVGPSGSGKTTLLRCVAGLERSPTGAMRLGNEVWQDESAGVYVPIHRRAVGYVFQEARLFPHLTVRSNLTYGWDRTPPRERRVTIERVVEILGIGHLLGRRPQTLSGGEQQRVAIGRALLTSPRLLLLDEPLSALDAPRKREILPFIKRLQQELEVPILYVSHSMSEVLQLADRAAVLRGGQLVAVGPTTEVFSSVDLQKTMGAQRVGAVIDARVAEHEPEFGLTRLEFNGRSLYVPLQPLNAGDPLRVQIFSRDVALVLGPPTVPTSVLNILEATVIDVRDGHHASVEITLDAGSPLVASITRKSAVTLALRPGQRVYAHIKAVALHDGFTD